MNTQKQNKMSSSTTTNETVNAKKRKNVNELNTKPAKVAKAEKEAKVNSKVKFILDSLCLRSWTWLNALKKIGHGLNEDHLKELSDQFVDVGDELKGMVDDCTDALCAAWENYSETIADFKDNGCQIIGCTWMPYKEEDVRAAIEAQRALNQFFGYDGPVTIGSKVLLQEDPVWAEIPNSDSDRYDVGLGVVGVVDYAGFNVKRGTGMKGPVYTPSIYVKLPDGTRLYYQGYGCVPISDWQIKVFDFLNKHPEFRDKYDLTYTDVDEEPLKILKLDRSLELLDLLRFPMDWVQSDVVKSKKKVSMLREMLLLIQQDNKAVIQELLDFLVVVEMEKQKVFGLDDVDLTFPGHLPTKDLQSIVREGKKYGYIEDSVVVGRNDDVPPRVGEIYVGEYYQPEWCSDGQHKNSKGETVSHVEGEEVDVNDCHVHIPEDYDSKYYNEIKCRQNADDMNPDELYFNSVGGYEWSDVHKRWISTEWLNKRSYTVKISLEHVILMFRELIETDPDLKEHRDIFKNNEWYGFEKDATDEAPAAPTTTTNP